MNDFGSNVFAPLVSAPLLARTDHGAPRQVASGFKA